MEERGGCWWRDCGEGREGNWGMDIIHDRKVETEKQQSMIVKLSFDERLQCRSGVR